MMLLFLLLFTMSRKREWEERGKVDRNTSLCGYSRERIEEKRSQKVSDVLPY